MKRRTIVIGAGINGLVCANYLQRNGCDVLLLERKPAVGGACTFETFEYGGKRYPYPTGASVFGMMQDFVFQETGLSSKLEVQLPPNRAAVYFGDETQGLRIPDAPEAFAAEVRSRWGEQGDVVGYAADLHKVRDFLIRGFRDAHTPDGNAAHDVLGSDLYSRWITGSAFDLLNHYFTSDRMKIYKSMGVTESGPVPIEAPTSAFNIALMNTGTVGNGEWGFVKGGLFQLPLTLAELNREAGVEIVTSATIESIDPVTRKVLFNTHAGPRDETAEAVFIATDPVSAADLIGNPELATSIRQKQYLGSSGKLVLFFSEPVKWKEGDADFRFLYASDDFGHFRRSNDSMRERKADFSPSSFQVYCEGSAMRKMGWNEGYDYLSIFFKDVGFGRRGAELPHLREAVKKMVLARTENPRACFGAVLLTPADLREKFFFPEGNIDHMELCMGQNFAARSFSTDIERAFYRLGAFDGVFYCGAGAYPCGSVAGTPGYMAAMQWLRTPSTPRFAEASEPAPA